jgi:hypothetical protein
MEVKAHDWASCRDICAAAGREAYGADIISTHYEKLDDFRCACGEKKSNDAR